MRQVTVTSQPGGSRRSTWLVRLAAAALVVAVGTIVTVAMRASRSPVGLQVAAAVRNTTATCRHMRVLGEALRQYHTEHGAYPKKLRDLAPKYLAESDLRPPGAGSYRYQPPPPDAAPDAVLVETVVDLAPGSKTKAAIVARLQAAGRIETIDPLNLPNTVNRKVKRP